MAEGIFSPIATSEPPQSPVAWSNFISGTNPGGHGIFDFIARDAETLRPYLSTARTEPAERQLRIGKFSLPLAKAKIDLLRRGHTLWHLLQEGGVDATVLRAPVNFPPTETKARTLAGLTTPDIHGSYGIFSFYTESPERHAGDVAGGHIERIRVKDGMATCTLPGPANTFRIDAGNVDIPFTIELDSPRAMARLSVQSARFLLRPGEWSEWVSLRFPMLSRLAGVSGICRFYLKQTKPYLKLYVSPININPADPSMPLSTPRSYAQDLAEEVGLFYTQGMPEDTSALSARVLDDSEFRDQAVSVLKEHVRSSQHELDRFKHGFLYLYFSSLDLNSHAFWRCVDRDHPLYSTELAGRHGDFLPWLYEQMDRMVGRARQHMDEHSILFVVSDHGFTSFRRQFNLNSWLMDHGYAKPLSRLDRGHSSFFGTTDWRQTRAHGLGINSLYLNLAGREPDGVVTPGDEAEELRLELVRHLTSVVDPQTGEKVVSHVYRPEDIYSGPCMATAPDLIVAYNNRYRASWDTILGKYPRDILLDNTDPWSGDHCMDSQFLPGVLMCNRRLAAGNPALLDMAPTMLQAFGVPVPRERTGRNLFG